VGSKTKISADLKVMDTGAFEVELAHKAGADMVAVAGTTENETIDAVFDKAKSFNMTAIVDSLGVENISGRLEMLEDKISSYIKQGGNAYLEFHIPIDIQTKTRDFTQVKKIYDRSHIPVAVAGGLDERTIPEVIGYGASVCIVGGAITRPKSGTPEEVVRSIKKIIYK
jgi:3-keto-L-gulonate-6-phosphate decarboxylase